MRENIRMFGCVAPDPAQFQVQGRPRLVTPEAREGVLEFLLDNGKLAYIDEVKYYLEEEWGIEVSLMTAQRLIKSLEMTKKVVSYSLSIKAPLTNTLAHR
jgi:transposase